MKTLMTRFGFLALAVCLSAVLLAARNSDIEVRVDPGLSEEDARYARMAKTFCIRMPELHLSRAPIDDDLSTHAFDLFIASLDFDNSYFLASDLERFSKHRTEMDDLLRSGDFTFARDVFKVYTNRVENRYQFVTNLLEKGFDLTVDESYVWQRKDADPARNETEWDDLWRRKIKNEYIARVLAREKADRVAEEKKAKEDEADAGSPDKADDEEAPASDKSDDSTEAGDSEESAAALKDVPKTPEELIRKRYEQQWTVMKDQDNSWIVQRYMSAIAQAFDPHTDYMSPTSQEDFDISMKLSLVGVGAMLSPEDGAAKVMRVIPGGPADQAGELAEGDKIIAVGQGDEEPVSILHWPLYKAVRLIRGEKGTKVVLVVIPASDPTGNSTKEIAIIRDEVKLEEQAAKAEVKALDPENEDSRTFGVIDLPAFYMDMSGKREGKKDYRSSRRDVENHIREMMEKDVDGIILDLRNNGGGSLIEAIEMTGLFFQVGPVVQVKESRGVQVLPDRDPGITYNGPLLVLVNRLSASASEILAAALQDYGRAIIVGDSKTHGKGTVQTVLPLNQKRKELGSVKVTTATFYRIAGGSTQLKGVTPDISIPSAYDTMEVGEEYLKHALSWTQVRPARYWPVGSIKPHLVALREKSLDRRNDDVRYENRRQLLKRLRDMRDEEEVSLHIDQRRERDAEEEKLRKQQEELLKEAKNDDDADEDENEEGEEGEGKKKQSFTDLVLLESMYILSDLIDLQKEQAALKQ